MKTKKEFREHLNLFHYQGDISQFHYLLDRKKRKKGYVSASTLQWYFGNGRMGDLLYKVDRQEFNNQFSQLTTKQ